MMERPPFRVLAALALVTAATLAEQVIITRLFSAALAYHFTFLAISVAMLGTGAAALLLYVRPGWFSSPGTEQLLARWAVLFALSLVLVPLGLVHLDFSGISTLSAGFAFNLTLAAVLAALPPFASGLVVALAIDRYARSIGHVYAYDLAGAGVGALAVVPVLWLGPAPLLLLGLAALVGGAALLFAPRAARERRGALGAVVLALAGIATEPVTGALYLEPRYDISSDAVLVGERWTPLARVMGYELTNPGRDIGLLLYDRVYAPVPVVEEGKVPDWRRLRAGPASVGFAFTGPGKTLVIGGGGGRDIYNALSNGQMPVHVIELSEGNRRMVDEDLGYLSGAPYSYPGVATMIGDGRSLLAASDETYDQIHIGFTDTLSANAAQGFALTENNLYTVEAYDAYFDHLAPYGLLNVSRLLKLVGDEALRVTVLTLEALRRRGVENPFDHVVVILGSDILGPPIGTVLARQEPFTPEELSRLRKLVSERANGILLQPGGPNQLAWADLASAPSIEAFLDAYPLDVSAPTDDKPFFFNMGRLRDLGRFFETGYAYEASPMTILLLTLVILIGLSFVAFVLPLRLVRTARRPTVASLSYFGAIGLGFLLLEMVLIQRFVLFLGYPTYALSIVLSSLLLTSGLGAYLTTRARDPRRALTLNLALASGFILAAAIGLESLLRALIDLPFAARAVVAGLLITPFGLTLGAAMPLGLRRFLGLFGEGLAFAWGINGIASVLASVLGMVVAIQTGFSMATAFAGACYVFALGHALLGRWPEPEPAR
jgi:hypothetical protein